MRAGAYNTILSPVLGFAKRFFLGLFFVPHNRIEAHPSESDLAFDEVRFSSLDARTLHGFFLKARGRVKGTLVHCHGNFGNVSTHFPLMRFLVEAGYHVFVFDYGGYGESEGRPSPEEIIADTQSALAYVRSRKDVDPLRIGLFGQSLGGAAAAGAMARDTSVRCAILEGTFTTYREMAFATWLGRLLFFITPFVIPDVGPRHDLPGIAPRPVLIVHGDLDDRIPVQFARTLFETAREVKSLAILKGFGHLEGAEAAAAYREIIVGFLDRHLAHT